jgi:Tfp pilus assembly protein PilF/4-amino-4-deoxy-L-arabinose transferase-like glycosyltransferase
VQQASFGEARRSAEGAKAVPPALVIFVVALVVRLVHIWQIRGAPFFTVLMGDSRGYDAWAQRIANGDWFGSDVFYQAPLYPYFLGTIYTVAGHDLLIVRICQAIVGAASCVLLGLTAWRLWSKNAGYVAGLALALYAPAIFFDGLIQKAVLDVFFVCLALWLMSRIMATGRGGPMWPLPSGPTHGSAPTDVRTWLLLGLTMGALALTRENAMVFVLVIMAWILIGPRSAIRLTPHPAIRHHKRIAAAGAFIFGLAIVLLPVAVRNSIVGGGFYVTTAQFGPNFYLGNNAYADGTAQSLRVGRGSSEYERQDATELAEHAMGRRLTPGEVSQYWTDRALTFITSQPGAWLSLMMRKFALLWNAREMLDTESQESYAEWSTPVRLGALVGHFGVLVPLALFGVCATWSERKRLWVLHAMVAAYAASVLLFFIYARYRFPLVPFLMLFGAAGIVAASRLLGLNATGTEAPAAMPSGLPRGISVRTRWGWGPSASEKMLTVVGVAGLIASAVFTNWPVLSPNLMRAVTEHNLGAALQSDGRVDDAIDHYRRALAFKSDHAPALNNMGTALAAKGDVTGAIENYERALAILPDYASAHYNLANALLQSGKPDKATDHFRQALQSAPGSADVHNNLGIALADQGRFDEAMAEYRKALEFDPNSAKTHRNLGSVLASAGRADEAIESLRRAVGLDPRDGPAHYDLATLLVEAQQLPEAVVELRAALALMPDSVDVHNNLGIALASLGRLDEAIGVFRRALTLQPDFAPARQNLTAALEHQQQLKARPRP